MNSSSDHTFSHHCWSCWRILRGTNKQREGDCVIQ